MKTDFLKTGGRLGLMGLMVGLTTACGTFPQNQTVDTDASDPYVAFTNAATAVEPLINPELEALAAARQPDPAPPATPETVVRLPPVTPLEVEADMAIAATPTLLPLNEYLYQRFIQAGYRGVMEIKTIDATTAIQRFCQQPGLQLLTINRPMTAAEMAACSTKGRQPVSFPIGKDALLVIVNQQNRFVRGVTVETLKAILTRETWSAVAVSWPNKPIERELIGPNSTAVSLLTATLFSADTAALVNAPNTNFYDSAAPMVQALSATPYSVGIISYSTYQRLPQTFKAVPINGISASLDTVESGTYPLGQTLFLYADRPQLTPRSPTSAVINFYLTHMNEAASEVALLPPTPMQLNDSKSQWLNLMEPNTISPK